MKKKLPHIVLCCIGLLASSWVSVYGSPSGSSNPPSPPGGGSDGALVKDVPEMPLENSFFLVLLAMAIAFYYFKPILFSAFCKIVRKPNN